MLAGICLGTNNLEKAGAFYDHVLQPVGMVRLSANEREIGYGTPDGEPVLWVLMPFNEESATFGNGTQVIFDAADSNAVDSFHLRAMELGGTDEGAPGPRDYAEGYYGAYCRDLDGNKLHAFVMRAP